MSEPVAAPLAFEDFFEAERQGLYGSLCLMTGDPHEADEIAQEALVRVWERWDRVGRMEKPLAYTYAVAVNLLRSRYRRAMRAARHPGGPQSPQEAVAALESRDEVFRALRKVSPRQRAAIVLTELLDFDSKEAGRMLGVSDGTVRALAHQGRDAMRTLLGAR